MKRMVCILLALLLTGCGAEQAQSAAALTAQQREVYGTVSAMVGNEMTLALGSYTAEGDTGMEMDDAAAQEEQRREASPGTAGAGRGKMAAGQQPEGEAEAPPELPAGEATAPGEMGQTVTMQQGVVAGIGGVSTGGFVPSGEEATYQLPVDLPVTVAGSEATTSFRRIAAENLVRLVLEETAQGEQVVRVEILR